MVAFLHHLLSPHLFGSLIAAQPQHTEKPGE
jgi:hypothetical protein